MTKKKLFALILSAVLLVSAIPSAYADLRPDLKLREEVNAEKADADKMTPSSKVHIATAEALQTYALCCRMDTFSENTLVILDCDIDLKGEPFYPFPAFCGTFEGNGHTIRGFINAEDGSNEGLFRFVEENGEIRNLNVVGSVTPDEGRSEVGGIAGTNYGVIEKCTFSGIVSGKEKVGGICGYNSGRIINCRCDGTVSGKTMVGGICGSNSGSIYGCRNSATVNPDVWNDGNLTSPPVDVSDVAALNISSINKLNIADIITADSADTTTDVGGIVGYSDYIVYVCINYGDVGYRHYGYNIGGIAGRQSNFVSKCVNYGSIYGRNDVGGIVGQNEPYMSLTDRQSMGGEIQMLSSTFTEAMETFDENTQTSSEIVEDIASDTGDTVKATEKALNDTGKMDDLEDDIEDDFGVRMDLSKIGDATVEDKDFDAERDPTVVDKALDKTKDVSSNVDKDYIDDIREKGDNAKKGDAWGIAIDAVNDAGINTQIDKEKSDKAEDAAIKARDKSYELIGKESVDNITGGNITGDDIGKLIDVGGKGGKAGTDWITRRRELRLEQEQKDQDVIVDDVTEGAKSVISLGDNISLLSEAFGTTMDNLTGNFKVVNEHFTNVMNMMADALAGNFNADVIMDVSAISNADSMHGTVTNSINNGAVEGDECTGGIAGSMGIESRYDLNGVISDGLASNGIFTNTYETTCIIRACENNGSVNTKRDHSGGIVGKQDIGLIVNSENYGDITGTGHYYGGVVGRSYATVNTCYSKCLIDGENYIGGIAGSGTIIYDCISLSTIPDSSGSFVGAIAGSADMDADREVDRMTGISADAINISSGKNGSSGSYTFIKQKCVTGNYFVSDNLGGVNGVSYTDHAEPVAYRTVMEFVGLPEKLHKWEITFRADGRVVGREEFEYGGTLEKMPEVPKKDGYTGFWEDFDTENLTSSKTVEAVYVKNGTAVESNATRKDTGLCIVLAEGALDNNTSVNAFAIPEYAGAELHGGRIDEAWRVELSGQIPEGEQYLFHYNPLEKPHRVYSIYVLTEEGNWQKTQTAEQGSYIVFHGPSRVTFAAVSTVPSGIWIAAAAGGAAFLAIVFICMKCLKKKRM